jgi:hypothetical protein
MTTPGDQPDGIRFLPLTLYSRNGKIISDSYLRVAKALLVSASTECIGAPIYKARTSQQVLAKRQKLVLRDVANLLK